MALEVLHLILCDEVQADPNNFHRLSILGLINTIRSRASPPFPVFRPAFSALLVLTGAVGSGEIAVRILRDRPETLVYLSNRRRVRFVGDSSAVLTMSFRIQNCTFPDAGLYWVEVTYENAVLVRQRLFLKS